MKQKEREKEREGERERKRGCVWEREDSRRAEEGVRGGGAEHGKEREGER
jgi:hypothetical protein